MRLLCLIVGLFLVSGCSWFRAHVYVEDRVVHQATPSRQYTAASVQLVTEDPARPRTVPRQNLGHDQVILAGLEAELYDDDNFTRGEGLRMLIRVMRTDAGKRLARTVRTLRLAGVGEGKIIVRVGFYDQSGQLMREVHFKSTLSGGIAGGDFEVALVRTGEEIAEYAVDEFLAPR